MSIETINGLSTDELTAELLACCHCANWADRVALSSPFSTPDHLVECCEDEWHKATEAEILEAFAGHPQIGDMSALRNKYAATASAEQGQVAGAEESVLVALRDRNQEYLEKFGFIFIVCASGKSAAEMLELLEARIGNNRANELANGAREQGEIMKLRLAKLLEDD